jgi:hypothetical protein
MDAALDSSGARIGSNDRQRFPKAGTASGGARDAICSTPWMTLRQRGHFLRPGLSASQFRMGEAT